ncbi:MAG TPA: rRNA maturation RNase YbeY [Firmicutes bacterium]|nr:rRNA maturation RNase YbeY [Candidatus Fermentithermobacillaceae bacterium]
MAVDVQFSDVRLSPEEEEEFSRLAEEVVTLCLEAEGRADGEWEVSVVFSSDQFIARLNKDYRGIEGPTDVLSFALTEGEEPEAFQEEGMPFFLGDIVISLDTARSQAQSAGRAFLEEVAFLLIHGTLHLLGHDHDTVVKEAVMWKRQDEILKEYLSRRT